MCSVVRWRCDPSPSSRQSAIVSSAKRVGQRSSVDPAVPGRTRGPSIRLTLMEVTVLVRMSKLFLKFYVAQAVVGSAIGFVVPWLRLFEVLP